MEATIDRWTRELESGRLSRRELTVRLMAVISAAGAVAGRVSGAAEGTSTFDATGLNHIALRVTDIPRSRDFYVRHLGLRVARESAGSCFLECGEDFVALFRGGVAGMDHYCYSVEGYSVGGAAEKLRAEGLAPRVVGRRIYFRDPDGLEVQLAAADHRA